MYQLAVFSWLDLQTLTSASARRPLDTLSKVKQVSRATEAHQIFQPVLNEFYPKILLNKSAFTISQLRFVTQQDQTSYMIIKFKSMFFDLIYGIIHPHK